MAAMTQRAVDTQFFLPCDPPGTAGFDLDECHYHYESPGSYESKPSWKRDKPYNNLSAEDKLKGRKLAWQQEVALVRSFMIYSPYASPLTLFLAFGFCNSGQTGDAAFFGICCLCLFFLPVIAWLIIALPIASLVGLLFFLRSQYASDDAPLDFYEFIPHVLTIPADAFPSSGRVHARGHVVLEVRNLVKPGRDTIFSVLNARAPNLQIEQHEGTRSYACVRVSLEHESLVRAMIQAIGQERARNASVHEVPGTRVYSSPRE
jgi:hypothetical protein